MAISINWGTYEIFVPRADLTLVQSTPIEIREMDINWFRLQLKDLEDSPEGMACPDTHTHNTQVNLGGITYARVVEVLDPYTITFEDGQYAVNLFGANSNLGDKVNVNQVSVRSNNSAGLISSPLIEYASFEGGVWYDEENGTLGTIFPTGTHLQPAKSLDDVKVIADYRGFNVVYIVGNANINSGLDFNEFVFEGQTHVNNHVFITDDAQVYGAVFRHLTIAGILDGGNELSNCTVSGVTYVNGHIHDCELVGEITLAGNQDAIIANCITFDPYEPPIINMGGSGQNLVLPNYSGLLTITNLSGSTNFVGIGMNAGETILDSRSVTAGIIHIAGIGTLTDENGAPIRSGIWNGGVTVINSLMSKETVAEAVEQEIGTEIQYGVYGGEVCIDVNVGVPGTSYPSGSRIAPSNNLTDAVAIAVGRGFTRLHFMSDFTFDSSVMISDFILVGEGKQMTNFTFDNANVIRCLIQDAYCTGTLTGIIGWKDAHLDNTISTNPIPSNQTIVIENSIIQGALRVPSGYTGSIQMLDCWAIPDSNGIPPIFDFNNCGGSLQVRNLSGFVTLENVTNPNNDVRIFLNSGGIRLAQSVTNGFFRFTGIGNLINNSTSTGVVETDALISKDIISEAVWDEPISDHLISGTTGNSVGIQQFNGRVCVSASGISGTTFPLGTENSPVNNLADAITISQNIGVRRLCFQSDFTIDQSINISNYDLIGQGITTTTLTFEAGCVLLHCQIFDATATGNLTGVIGFFESKIVDLGSIGLLPSGIEIIARHCSFNGTVTLPSNYYGLVTVIDCYSDVPGNNTPILDFGNSTADLQLRNWTGGIELRNMTSGNTVSIDLISGNVKLHDSVINATIVTRGVGKLVESSTGEFIKTGIWNGGVNVNNDIISKGTISEAVWDEPLADHVIAGSTGRSLSLSEFGGKVWLDPTTSYSGTTFPIGTRGYPVNNGPDALLIAAREFIKEFRIQGTFVTTTNLSSFTIGGDTFLDDGLIFNNNTYNIMSFRDLHLSGMATFTETEFKNCFIENIDGISGEMFNCRLKDSIKIEPGKSLSGVEMVIEGDFTTIDLQNTPGTTFSCDINSGYVLIINSVPGCLIEVNLKGGEIELDSSCTGGDFYAEGVGVLYGDPVALGFDVKANHLIAIDTITDAVWNKTLP